MSYKDMRSLRQRKKTIMTVDDLWRYSQYEGESQVKASPVSAETKVGQINNEVFWKSGTKKDLEGRN